ncbi:hypothetical protein MPHL43072_14775 [Mycolicibacterium phlei DSM 43072]|nr:hypothetical protein MPHLEI_09484 [Mycolicibacterium phlei RIVM601174]KXW71747.1 hypothetical protein MPHL43072_14775 [Mycolicibacterium phlei DSM 43072]KXW78591.1 hypothetical protein JL15_05125 [Mycolicibacterium phlei DSM 43071]
MPVGDHLLTLVAYVFIAVLVGVSFWRAQRGTIAPLPHAVVSVVFGALWPMSVPYQALVRVLARAAARRRSVGAAEEPVTHR